MSIVLSGATRTAYSSAYTKVYESVCPVGVGVHCDALRYLKGLR